MYAAVNETPWERWVATLPSGSYAVNALSGFARFGGPPPNATATHGDNQKESAGEAKGEHEGARLVVQARPAAEGSAAAVGDPRYQRISALIAGLARAATTGISDISDKGLADLIWSYSMLWRRRGTGCGLTVNLMSREDDPMSGIHDLDAASHEIARRAGDPERIANITSLSRVLFAWSRLHRNRGYEPPTEALNTVCTAVHGILRKRYDRLRAVADDDKAELTTGGKQVCSHQDLISVLIALTEIHGGTEQELYGLAWSIAGVQVVDAVSAAQQMAASMAEPLPKPRIMGKNGRRVERVGNRIAWTRVRNFTPEEEKRAMRLPDHLRTFPRLSQKHIGSFEALLSQQETTRKLHPRLMRRLQQALVMAAAHARA